MEWDASERCGLGGTMPMKDDSTPVSVLIVEDSPVVRRRIRNMLADIEHVRTVGEAHSAPEAIKTFEALQPDFVILDVRLAGGSSGLDVLRQIRRKARPCTTIMLTNLAFWEVRQECMSLGADHFFNKATEFERVLDVVASPRANLVAAQAR